MSTVSSLARQIAPLQETAPVGTLHNTVEFRSCADDGVTVDFDPEDVQSHGVEREDQMDVDLSAAREHYVEVGSVAVSFHALISVFIFSVAGAHSGIYKLALQIRNTTGWGPLGCS